uniref:Uncharacterized protein n=1 Tax=Panagrolaimus davidi TaxID=227884 RepID=A0A914Q207_9BILA
MHFNKLCYIYDRYGVINGKPEKDVAYPIKINKDFQDGKYITVVEICPLSKKGFMPRKVEMEISGEGFVANDEIIFCKQHSHIPIYYSKDQFKYLKLGTFGQIHAIYDPKLQQYSLSSFYLNIYKEKLEPFIDTKQNDDKKCTFHIPIKLQNGLLVSEFFGVISVKPFRRFDKKFDTVCDVFYVGNDPKYQTPFAEDEQYMLNNDYDSDGVYFPPL